METGIEAAQLDGDDPHPHPHVEKRGAWRPEPVFQTGQQREHLSGQSVCGCPPGSSLRLQDLRVGVDPAGLKLSTPRRVDHLAALEVSAPQPGTDVFWL